MILYSYNKERRNLDIPLYWAPVSTKIHATWAYSQIDIKTTSLHTKYMAPIQNCMGPAL